MKAVIKNLSLLISFVIQMYSAGVIISLSNCVAVFVFVLYLKLTQSMLMPVNSLQYRTSQIINNGFCIPFNLEAI